MSSLLCLKSFKASTGAAFLDLKHLIAEMQIIIYFWLNQLKGDVFQHLS